jgi:transposase
MGLAPEPPAGLCAWLQIDVPAPSDLAVVWLERGTNAQRRSGIRHARHGLSGSMWKWRVLMAVMIGIDPHKGSHTAVAVTAAEQPLGKVRVRACPAQAEQLVTWAAAWPDRIWAVEGAPGLGRLLAQQLIAAGERVLDVQPKLAARVRLLQTENSGQGRPQRCPVRRGGGLAFQGSASGNRRRSRHGAQNLGEKAS